MEKPSFLKDKQVFIIAELSANHNNDFDLTIKTIDAISESGADAIKVQTFTPDSLTLDVDNEYFGPRKEGLWKGARPYDLYKTGMLPFEWQPKIKEYAERKGLTFFSSPFDKACTDFLADLEVPMYKVASAEITDTPLISHIASKGKPVIISTGMANMDDIEAAVNACRAQGNNQIALLKCTSEYPAPIEMANLATIPNLRDTFKVISGVSDHTMGPTVPIVAVALGAQIVEKHFILSRDLGGIDSVFSMEPSEFSYMVKEVRAANLAVGQIDYTLSEKNRLRRRSLFIAQDLKAGDIITEDSVRSVRPGHGLHPGIYTSVIGKKATMDLKKGTPLEIGHFI